MTSQEIKYQKLRNCFYAGYSIPQFCRDRGYRYPVIISDSVEILWEMHTQFWLDKEVYAQFRVIGKAMSVKSSANVIIPALRLNSDIHSIDKSTDLVLWMSELKEEKFPHIRLYKLGQIIRLMEVYVYAERPIYDYIRRHPGVKVITYSHPNMIENDYNTETEKKIRNYDIKGEIANAKNGGVFLPPRGLRWMNLVTQMMRCCPYLICHLPEPIIPAVHSLRKAIMFSFP